MSEAKTTTVAEGSVEEEEKIEAEQPWTRDELLKYLSGSATYQRVLLAVLAQLSEEKVTRRQRILLMNDLAKKKPKESIEKEITGYDIAGARAGLKMRRKPLNKEDIIFTEWDETLNQSIYKIKAQYKSTVLEWVKKEDLLV